MSQDSGDERVEDGRKEEKGGEGKRGEGRKGFVFFFNIFIGV